MHATGAYFHARDVRRTARVVRAVDRMIVECFNLSYDPHTG